MSAPGQVGFRCVLTLAGLVIGRAKDVDGPNASGEAVDVTTRASNGWKEHKQGLKEWDASVDQLFVADDTGLQALRSAFLLGSEISADFDDGNGNGFTGAAIVTAMNLGQPLNDAVLFPITLKGTGALVVKGAS